MDTRRKKFDPQLYAKYDRLGKGVAIRFFQWLYPSCKVIEEPFGIYGIDLEITTGWRKYFIDVEVRPDWHGSTFPFTTVHLPIRKLKHLQGTDHVGFLSINNELTRGLLFRADEGQVIEVRNKYVQYGEQFLDIPIKDCVYLDLYLSK